jgi:hypothetical protein
METDGEDDQGDGEVIAGAVRPEPPGAEQGHRGGLGGGGDEGDDLIGAALVNVRGPEVEGEHGQLKEEARHGQEDADDADGAVDQLGHLGQDVDQVGGAGGAEDVAQAEEHEARRHGPDEQILDARFHVDAVTPAERHQDIQGVGRQLQGHIDGEEFHRAHQHHHADGGGGEEEIEFRLVAFLNVGQVVGDGQDQEESQGQGELEDLAEQVHPVGLEKQIPLLEQAVAVTRTPMADKARAI